MTCRGVAGLLDLAARKPNVRSAFRVVDSVTHATSSGSAGLPRPGTRLGEPFVARIAAAMSPHLLLTGKDAARILPARLGDLAGALGAATQAAELLPSRRHNSAMRPASLRGAP